MICVYVYSESGTNCNLLLNIARECHFHFHFLLFSIFLHRLHILVHSTSSYTSFVGFLWILDFCALVSSCETKPHNHIRFGEMFRFYCGIVCSSCLWIYSVQWVPCLSHLPFCSFLSSQYFLVSLIKTFTDKVSNQFWNQ